MPYTCLLIHRTRTYCSAWSEQSQAVGLGEYEEMIEQRLLGETEEIRRNIWLQCHFVQHETHRNLSWTESEVPN
jgi:hypothetical protein